MDESTGLILLAAGNSSRMGQCKFLLPTKEGITFFENILHSFNKYGIKRIVVVTQRDKIGVLSELCFHLDPKPVFIVNEHPELERFYSLQVGIEGIGDVDHCFIHNADTPFVDKLTLEKLYSNRYQANYIVPVFGGKGGHPILVDKRSLQFLAECPVNAVLKEELSKLERFNVSVEDEMVGIDIDTPEEYNRYCR